MSSGITHLGDELSGLTKFNLHETLETYDNITALMFLLIAAAIYASLARALDNGLAITPQMGWDDWNSFGCNVSEDVLLTQAKLIVDLGLKDLGYHYILLDDCWSNGRNTSGNGSIMVDTKKFPRGSKQLCRLWSPLSSSIYWD